VNPQTLFDVAFPLAAPFWLLMIALPHWSWTPRIIASPWIAAPPLLVHVVLLVPQFATYAGPIVSPDLAGLAVVLGTPAGAATIWAHAIGFDLLIGRWMYFDARERGVPAPLMAPVLLLTILLSPLGFLGYLLVRIPFRSQAGQPGRDAQAAAVR
jgi:Domain of unknown function (DUF4281)